MSNESLWLHHRRDRRLLGIVAFYWVLLGAMYFVPGCRNVFFLVAACFFSFLNTIVIHIHLHRAIFKSKFLNRAFRNVLSFGALYPASANTPSHNIVHHHYHDQGAADWAANHHSRFKWNLLNLIHFPNAVGPRTFNGVKKWAALRGRGQFRRQYRNEILFAFGLTCLLATFDFWTTLFFIVIPQLWGARGVLRYNLLQHDGCDQTSRYNHARNFVGKIYNWFMCNNGYHTIHHNLSGIHWTELANRHRQDILGQMHPSLDEKTLTAYILKTYVFRWSRPPMRSDLLKFESEAQGKLKPTQPEITQLPVEISQPHREVPADAVL